mmetsp:Transcript_23855/g.77657  ORF Transcript_23855/g.77657 Transcript_23855/m.77657 type:complete len:221 (-) Transcript_23855:830-1492(-)
MRRGLSSVSEGVQLAFLSSSTSSWGLRGRLLGAAPSLEVCTPLVLPPAIVRVVPRGLREVKVAGGDRRDSAGSAHAVFRSVVRALLISLSSQPVQHSQVFRVGERLDEICSLLRILPVRREEGKLRARVSVFAAPTVRSSAVLQVFLCVPAEEAGVRLHPMGHGGLLLSLPCNRLRPAASGRSRLAASPFDDSCPCLDWLSIRPEVMVVQRRLPLPEQGR